jgi:hypothetical protein
MNQEFLDTLIDGLIHSWGSVWTSVELANATGQPLAEVQGAISRLVAAGRVISTGQEVRKVIPSEGHHA